MPFSPVFALPYSAPEDQPGITLHGGVPPTALPANQQILALRVDDVLAGMVATDTSLDARVTALETAVANTRWRHITEGAQVGGTEFTLVVPAGYKMLRLTMTGDTTATTQIGCQINAASPANAHISGILALDADTGAVDVSDHFVANLWRVGEWATTESNFSQISISPVDGTFNPSFVGIANRISTTASSHQFQPIWGKFQADAVVATIRVSVVSDAFADVQWTLEGYLSP